VRIGGQEMVGREDRVDEEWLVGLKELVNSGC
jgi:hypothetical protein